MTINSTTATAGYSDYQTNSTAESNGDFASMMDSSVKKETKTKRELETEKTDEEIKSFFAKMKASGSVLKYVMDENIAKIKEMIEKKKEDLKKANGFYNEPPLSPEQKTELMKGIEEALAEYEKQLMKELEDKSKAEKAAKSGTKISLQDYFVS